MARARYIALSVLLFALSVAPFSGTVRYGLVNCDDYNYFAPGFLPVENGVTWASVRYAFTSWQNAMWAPITYLAYIADYAIGGRDKAACVAHAGSVAWHGANAVLLFWLLMALLGQFGNRQVIWVCAMATLFWAWHPLRCESVAWIASKKDVLSAFGLLSALLCWTRWRTRSGTRWYVFAMIFLVLGAMCKPSVMVFIGIVCVLDWLVFKVWRKDAAPRLSLEYALPLVLCAAIGVGASLVQSKGGGTTAFVGVPLWWRLVNAVCSIGIYVKNTVYPLSLAPQCMMQWPGLPRHLLTGVALCAALLIAGKTLYDRHSALLAGLLWFLGCLVPFLGISGFGYHAFADRFTYIPAMGLSLMIAVALARLLKQRRVAWIGTTCAVLCLAALSARQCRYWRDDLALWSHTLKVDGRDNYIANLSLGSWHWEFDHDVQAAADHYARAWKHDRIAVSHHAFYYVAALVEAGRREEAEAVTRELLSIVGTIARAGENAELALLTREMSCILLFATDPLGVANAEKKIAELMAIDSKEHPNADLLFLRGVAADTRGEARAAASFYRKCRASVPLTSYVRYSFLTDDWMSRHPLVPKVGEEP